MAKRKAQPKKQTKKQHQQKVSGKKRQQPVVMEPTPEQIEKFEMEELESAKEQFEAEQETVEPPKPFDPKAVVAKYLKQNGA